MVINGSSINDISINGERSAIQLDYINESLLISSSATSVFGRVGVILENLKIIDGQIYSSNFNIAINDALTAVDSTLLLFDSLVSESIQLSDAAVGNIQQIELLIESLLLSESTVNKANAGQVISESLSMVDAILFGIRKEIAESIVFADDLTKKELLAETIIELLDISGIATNNKALQSIISEAFSVSENTDTSVIFSSLIEDIIRISILSTKNPEFIAYLLSPETMAVTTYTNYNFIGSCNFQNEVLLINENGLYKQGGTQDDGVDIVAAIQTASLSFGTSHLKRCLNLYLGLSSTGNIILKASADGGVTSYYEITRASANLQTQRITLGKGMKGRYWQFELVTTADFELESMDFLPVTLSRRI